MDGKKEMNEAKKRMTLPQPSSAATQIKDRKRVPGVQQPMKDDDEQEDKQRDRAGGALAHIPGSHVQDE